MSGHKQTSQRLRTFAGALVLLYAGCTSYKQEPVNDWLRIRRAIPTAILPHTWYVGESWTRVEYKNQAGKWVVVPRSEHHPLALIAYDKRRFAIGVENSKHDPIRSVNVYSQTGERQAFEVADGFLNAHPHISKDTVLVFGRAGDKSYRLDEYDRMGVRVSRALITDPNDRPADNHLMLHGFCNDAVVIAPVVWDQQLWLLQHGVLVPLVEGSMPCESVLIPSCAGACSP